MLRDVGYRTLVASRPSQALELARDRPDVLLTDVRMPEMSGIELAGQMRKAQPHLKVIYMSGLPHDAVDGASTFVQKPVDIDKVVGLINEAREKPAERGRDSGRRM